MNRTSWYFVFAVVMLAITPQVSAYGSAKQHMQDFCAVFDGYDDYRLRMFYEDFSSRIDTGPNSIEKQIRVKLKEMYPDKEIKLTKHRYIAHSWNYGGSIPDLSLLEKNYPGCKPEVVKIWQRFCRETDDYIKNEFALQRSPWIAKSYGAILYYTHLLGDWQPFPANRDFNVANLKCLMEPEEIVDNLVKHCREMFKTGDHQEFLNDFESSLKSALRRGWSPQAKAKNVREALIEMRLGTKIHNTFAPKYLDESRHPWTDRSTDGQKTLPKAA